MFRYFFHLFAWNAARFKIFSDWSIYNVKILRNAALKARTTSNQLVYYTTIREKRKRLEGGDKAAGS